MNKRVKKAMKEFIELAIAGLMFGAMFALAIVL